jgi:hypothetical protein
MAVLPGAAGGGLHRQGRLADQEPSKNSTGRKWVSAARPRRPTWRRSDGGACAGITVQQIPLGAGLAPGLRRTSRRDRIPRP